MVVDVGSESLEIFGLPLDQSAGVVVEKFIEGIQNRDQTAVEACLTAEALSGHSNSPRGLARQISRKGLELRVMPVGKCENGRASVRALVTSRDDESLLQSLWFMCLQSENWLIGGVTRSRALVGLFLREEIAPHHGIDHLPLAPDVEAYLDEMEAGAMDSRIRECWPQETGLRLGSARLVLKRALVPVLGPEEEPAQRPHGYVVLNQTGETWAFNSIRRGTALETMVTDMDVPWTSSEEEDNDRRKEIK